MSILYSICLFLGVFFAAPSFASAGDSLAITTKDGAETIILRLSGVAEAKPFFLDNPDRLVVDVPINKPPALAMPDHYDGELISKMRVGQFNATTARIVFELVAPSVLVAKEQEAGRIAITLASNKKSSKPIVKAEAKPPAKPMIVIDPGHGGQDPGAIGPGGTQEKNITLQYARSLRDALLKTGRYRVYLTRDEDRFIVLRERVAIARRMGASLFISIHADSAPNDLARGLSVYTVSEKASDAEAEALAARENKVDVLSGMDLSNEREDVADILISLAQRDTKNQSALLADNLVMALDERVRLLTNTHRFAGFAVLKAPDIPSVLVEAGFLSHPQEEKLLKSQSYREKLVSGIVAGVDGYFKAKGKAQE